MGLNNSDQMNFSCTVSNSFVFSPNNFKQELPKKRFFKCHQDMEQNSTKDLFNASVGFAKPKIV